MFYVKKDNRIVCHLCMRECSFYKDGDFGFCRAREFKDGELVPTNLQYISSLALDPIEKKPLYHYKPGSKIVSIGRNYCNLECDFCQNYTISQQNYRMQKFDWEELIDVAKRYKLVAFTYDEPLVSYEFLLNGLDILQKRDIEAVVVSNGILNSSYFIDVAKRVGAFNIDVKSYEDSFYDNLTHIKGNVLDNIFKNIEIAKKYSHVELTYLLIENVNSDESKFEKFVKNIANRYGKSQVLHISRYFPMYKLNVPATSIEIMIRFFNIAKSYLDYVYLGNMSDKKYNSTVCPKCGEVVIEREGYYINNRLIDNRCFNCSSESEVVL